MQRRGLLLSSVISLGAHVVGCNGDDVMEANSNSASDTESGSATENGSLSLGSDTDADSSNSNSNSNSNSATDTESTTGSASVDSSGTVSASDTDSTSNSGTQGDATAGDTTDGDDTDTDTGGPGDPPPDPPGVDVGFCTMPGEEAWCYTGAPTTYNVGECKPGVQECVQIDLDLGEWGPCEDEQLPEQEDCDGLDNDCDGETDEDLGSTVCGVGLCMHEVPNCVDGDDNDCDPFDGGMMETCNGIDDDCDGQIDDGLGDQEVECGLGQCEHTVTACEDGEEPQCDPLDGASEEVCDGVDNDCDGDIDEDLPDLHCGVGQCEHDVPACINGIPQNCDPFDGASTEVCDGIDNDCDGSTDEDQGNWVCGDFECEVSVPQCIDGVPQPPESCVPEPGGDEICGDGIDNNCDGLDSDCAESFLVGTDNALRPIDIIWAVDGSGSMAQEMQTVEDNINVFATTLANSGSATRLHLITDRGTEAFEICVTPPLATANCGDNAPTFYQYDTNGGNGDGQHPMVHSSNALGRIMQQSSTWIPRLQVGSHIAFIATSDDDGDDVNWVAPQDPEGTDDCGAGNIINGTTTNLCRWDAPGNPDYTSLAYDWMGVAGFTTFMTNFFPNAAVVTDWTFYSIIGGTGTTVLTGADDQYEFVCGGIAENGEEYVKLSLLTQTQDSMTQLCAANWDLSSLANDIVSGIPNDTYILDGSPPGTCLQINPATIQVVVNGIPLANADWTYDAPNCTLTIQNNVPVVGDNVVIIYEIF